MRWRVPFWQRREPGIVACATAHYPEAAARGARQGTSLQNEIRSHTGLRGVAALCVVGYHQQFMAGYKLPFEALFHRAYLMVDLFFVLSGFVLSYVYSQKIDVRSFYRARFARIYPLHVFALLTLTVVTFGLNALRILKGHAPDDLGPFSDWFEQLVLLNAWLPAVFEWNKPSWSISAEAFAYLLFPLVMVALARWPRAVAGSMLAGVLLFYVLIGTSLDISVGLAILRCLAGFGLGMLLFRWRQTPLPDASASAIQLAALAWIVAVLLLPVRDPLIIPAFVGLVFATWRDKGLLAKMLAARPVHRLGELSYSIYLMHYAVGGLVGFAWFRTIHMIGLPVVIERCLFLACVLATVIQVSAWTYRYVERPFQDLLRGRSRKVEVAAPAP